MVQETPWKRTLGGSRVQMEIGEELELLGHHVEHYSLDEAFGGFSRSRWDRWTRPHFSQKAVPWVRANAARFDVIDALIGCLPVSKESLGFKGVLMSRSVALYSFYYDFERRKNAMWPDQREGTALGRARMEMVYRRDTRFAEDSIRASDIVNLCNTDEADFVDKRFGKPDKTAVLPLGISRERCQHFASAAAPSAERLARREVVFVGAWTPRKGAYDWAAIIAQVRKRTPDARFLFLGTGKDEATVRADLKTPEGCDWVRIVPRYDSEELPELIAQGSVGAFPSYIEGFPFGIIEKLASGLPTVAYDVPGPRDQLRPIDPTLLTPEGDAVAMANRLSDLLEPSRAEEYARIAARGREIALGLTWDSIAARTLRLYQAALSGAGPPSAVSAQWDGRKK
jgi:glycosyltransferase involved in cell wall biosynthesis